MPGLPYTRGPNCRPTTSRGLLTLLSVVCHPDGTAGLFWYDGDEPFAGHAVVTRLGADGECVPAGMP